MSSPDDRPEPRVRPHRVPPAGLQRGGRHRGVPQSPGPHDGETLAEEYELQFVYVDDGSRDSSLAQLLAPRGGPARLGDRLSRNFGHQMAVTAGLDAVDADAVIIMDTDLQDPPAVCLELVERWQEGADVVYAQRRTRDDTLFKRASADASTGCWTGAPRSGSRATPATSGCMDRKVVAELAATASTTGSCGDWSASRVPAGGGPLRPGRPLRRHTGYPLRKMMRFAGDGIFAFSTPRSC